MDPNPQLPISDSRLSTGEDVEAHLEPAGGEDLLPLDDEDVEAHIGLGGSVPTVGGVATDPELRHG